MELMNRDRGMTGSSSSIPIQSQEWSLESFLQHHRTKFHDKVTRDEAGHW